MIGEGQPFRRFDDIASGVIAKHIADHLGWSISVGEPFIFLSRASDPFINLEKEAPGVRWHEGFWKRIDAIRLTEATAVGCMKEVGEVLKGDTASEYAEYHRKLGTAMQVWAGMFEGQPSADQIHI